MVGTFCAHDDHEKDLDEAREAWAVDAQDFCGRFRGEIVFPSALNRRNSDSLLFSGVSVFHREFYITPAS